MLLKLCKYEFLTHYKKYFIVLIFIMLFRVIVDSQKNNTALSYDFGLIYTTSLIGAVAFFFFVIIHDYSHDMFGAQGYLLNTLPIEKSVILTSKLIMAMFWMSLVLLVSMLLSLMPLAPVINYITGLYMSSQMPGQEAYLWTVLLAYLFANIIFFCAFSSIFVVLTVNKTEQKKKLFSVLGGIMALQIVSAIVIPKMVPLRLFILEDEQTFSPLPSLLLGGRDSFLQIFDITLILVFLIFSISIYIWNSKQLKKHLEI